MNITLSPPLLSHNIKLVFYCATGLNVFRTKLHDVEFKQTWLAKDCS